MRGIVVVFGCACARARVSITLPAQKLMRSIQLFAVAGLLSLGVRDIESREGNYLRLDYTPTAFFYLDHSDFDTVNHIFRLEGYHRFRRLAVTIAQDIESTDNNTVPSLTGSGGFTRGANIDVATRQRVTLFNTRANASYDLTGKTSVTVGALFSATGYPENLINSQLISGTLGLDY